MKRKLDVKQRLEVIDFFNNELGRRYKLDEMNRCFLINCNDATVKIQEIISMLSIFDGDT